MTDILLGGIRFTATEVLDLTESATTPEHKVEEGYSIVDHILLQPAEFQLNLTLLESEVNTLKQLYEAKQPTTLACKFGIFEDVVVKELTITQGGSKNTFRAVVRVKQILKAKAKTATIPLQDLQLTPDESEASGGETATSLLDGWMVKEFSKYQQQQEQDSGTEKTWADQVFGFLSSFLGWGGG